MTKFQMCLSVFLLAELVTGFSMSMRDVGITDDIHRAASSLNDIFKESFEHMIGSLGKHGVYYLPEIRYDYDFKRTPAEEMRRVEFQASNGWMKFPKIKSADGMLSGALRKYKVAVNTALREILLVCVECLEVSAEGINYCYEATYGGKNVSGTITSGPVSYKLSMQLRITQAIRNNLNNHLAATSCNVTMGERSFELSDKSSFRSEVRGLRTLNFIADNIDGWIRNHFNSTVKAQLEKKLLTSMNKIITKHEVCEEFINQ